MKCEGILGNTETYNTSGKQIEYVDFEWFEVNRKLHVKTATDGCEIGIRFDDTILHKGIIDGDILAIEENKIYVARILSLDVLEVTIRSMEEAVKICYEIGNRHAPLFYGSTMTELITPYNQPMEEMFVKLNAQFSKKNVLIDFKKKISSGAGHHHEG